MSEDMNQIEVKDFKAGDRVKGQVTKVEEKQVLTKRIKILEKTVELFKKELSK